MMHISFACEKGGGQQTGKATFCDPPNRTKERSFIFYPNTNQEEGLVW
jgi:hypothetical protein